MYPLPLTDPPAAERYAPIASRNPTSGRGQEAVGTLTACQCPPSKRRGSSGTVTAPRVIVRQTMIQPTVPDLQSVGTVTLPIINASTALMDPPPTPNEAVDEDEEGDEPRKSTVCRKPPSRARQPRKWSQWKGSTPSPRARPAP